MGRGNRTTTKRKIEIRMTEGRGKGEGADYIPWLKVQNVPSEGIVTRENGWKTRRRHHLLSNNELWYFLLLNWSPIVVDIREQYPLLPIERTIEIAKKIGIEHPKDKFTKEDDVMTTDFMITLDRGRGRECCVRTVKPVTKLNKRQLEKFRIEEMFFKEQGIPWEIVTDENIPMVFAKNVDLVYDAYYLDGRGGIDEKTVSLLAAIIMEKFRNSSLPFNRVALEQDMHFGLEPGSCLYIAKHLIARKIWITDMNKVIKFNQDFSIEINPFYQQVGGKSDNE